MSNPIHEQEVQRDPATIDMAEINEHIAMGEAFNRLKLNPDFNKVIMEGYLEKKVMSSVSLLAVPSMKGDRPGQMEDLLSASNLKYFLSMVDMFYDSAVDPLTDEEKAEMEELDALETAGDM